MMLVAQKPCFCDMCQMVHVLPSVIILEVEDLTIEIILRNF
jgi:hypothetical protein